MAGPGGREVGRVAVRVVPDTSQFAKKLKGQLEALEKRLEVKIPTSFDVQTKGLNQRVKAATVAAQAAAKDIELQVDIDRNRLKQTAEKAGESAGNSFNSGFNRRVRPRTALIATLITAISLASPQLLVLAGSLAQVAGIAALIPALLGGIAAAAAVAVIGVAGLGTAFTKLSGSQTEFEQSIQDSVPAVQATARALRSVVQELDGLQAAVQAELFERLAAPLRDLAENLIPQLRFGLVGVADGLGDFVRSIVTELAAVGDTSDLTDFLNNVALALKELVPFGRSAVRILNDLGVVGGRFLPDLAASLSDVTGRFADFIAEARRSGDLEQFISDGISVVAELGEVAKNTLRFINGIIDAAEAAGGGTLGAFSDALKTMADVVNSPEFQKGLTEFFRGINEGVVGLTAGFPALGAALAEIGPILADFISELGPVLGEVLAEIAPHLPALVDGFAQLLTALLPLIPPFVELVVAMTPLVSFLLSTLADLLNLVVPLVAGAMEAFLGWTESISGGNAIIQALILVLSNLIGIVPLIIGLAQMLGQAIGEHLQAPFERARAAIASTLAGLLANVITAVTGIISAMERLAQIPVMVLGYMARLVDSVLDGMGRARDAAADGIQRVISQFSGLGGRLYQSGLSLIQGFANGILGGIGAAVSAASRALQAVRNLFPFSPAKEGPFSGRGWTLYSGQAIADGLAEGMLSRTGAVQSAASALLGGASNELQLGRSSFGADVRVFIGDQELTDIVDFRVDESNRQTKRRATAGMGRAR